MAPRSAFNTKQARLDPQDEEQASLLKGPQSTMYTERDQDEYEELENESHEFDIEALNPYERKCLLVNKEIDSMGMGRYQWYVWTLCGFGYKLDMLWIQAFNMTLKPIQQELGFDSHETGYIATAFRLGMLVGAFVWGFVADLVGRQWAFNLTVIFSATSGLSLGLVDTLYPLTTLMALVGFGVGGNIPIDTTIVLEFIPQNKRFLLSLLSIFQPIGLVISCLIAAITIPTYSCSPNFSEKAPLPSCNDVSAGQPCCSKADNYGWRYLMFTLGIITFGVFFARTLIFRMPESPKYLLCRGIDEAAIEVLRHMAGINGQKSIISIEDFHELASAQDLDTSTDHSTGCGKEKPGLKSKIVLFKRYKPFFKPFHMARLTIITWLTYSFMYGYFTAEETYLPRILARKNGMLDISLRFTYYGLVLTFVPGIFGAAIASLGYRISHGGRKYTMMVSALLVALALCLFVTSNGRSSNIVLASMEFFFRTIFTSVLYAWTPEVYPAPIRATASGVAAFCGRVGGIVALLIAQKLYGADGDENPNAVIYLAASLAFSCAIFVAVLPEESFWSQSI